MIFDPKRRAREIQFYRDTVDFGDAGEVLAARVALGTASWSECLRYWFKLGPSKKAIEAAANSREAHACFERMRRGEPPPS